MAAVQQGPDAVERENNDDAGTNLSECEVHHGLVCVKTTPAMTYSFAEQCHKLLKWRE